MKKIVHGEPCPRPGFTTNSALVLFFIGAKPILSRNPQNSGVSWSRRIKIYDTRYQILIVMARQKTILQEKSEEVNDLGK